MEQYDIFISHSSKNAEIAQQICKYLESRGVRCWIAPRNISPGASYPKEITKGIRSSTLFLVLITEDSVHSPHVNTETDIAFNLNKKILPFFTQNVTLGDSMQYYLARKQWIIGYESMDPLGDLLSVIQQNIDVHRHHNACPNSPEECSVPIPRHEPEASCAPPLRCAGTETSASARRMSKCESYRPDPSLSGSGRKPSFLQRIFGKKPKSSQINASAYAPGEIKPYRSFLVRVFLHRPEDTEYIDSMVESFDNEAIKKGNKPLQVPVKENDKLTVMLSMSDGVTIDEPMQSYVWNGQYLESDFMCELKDYDPMKDRIQGKVIVAVNNIPRGDLKFVIDIATGTKEERYAPIYARRYKKIFISYAHADYPQVKGIAEGCRINGTDYFFDRHTLKAGDIFKERILKYIDTADLFVLCWSKNAAESEWVQIERRHALEVMEKRSDQLAIYPLSLPPEAPLPADMSDKYNFAIL